MNKKYFLISVLFATAGFLATKFYRPFIYSHHIFDFWLADTIGSLVCVPAFCFFRWAFKPYSIKKKNNFILLTAVIYSFFWEGITAAVTKKYIDYRDIIAVWIGAGNHLFDYRAN